jgi:hypothetical protein
MGEVYRARDTKLEGDVAVETMTAILKEERVASSTRGAPAGPDLALSPRRG